jgi:hypothetical protein
MVAETDLSFVSSDMPTLRALSITETISSLTIGSIDRVVSCAFSAAITNNLGAPALKIGVCLCARRSAARVGVYDETA